MKITWDEPKRLSNIDKHGLDFADLSVDFFLAAQVVRAKSNRFVAIGGVRKKVVAVVFAPLGSEGVSIISMRIASRRERMALK